MLRSTRWFCSLQCNHKPTAGLAGQAARSNHAAHPPHACRKAPCMRSSPASAWLNQPQQPLQGQGRQGLCASATLQAAVNSKRCNKRECTCARPQSCTLHTTCQASQHTMPCHGSNWKHGIGPNDNRHRTGFGCNSVSKPCCLALPTCP